MVNRPITTEQVTTQKRRRRGRLHKGRLLGCIMVFSCICAATLYGIHTYNTPGLFGRWQSEETQKIVEFKKDGRVILKESTVKPTFVLLAPNRLSYTIDDKVFEMYYTLEGRTLKWGMSEDVCEVFKRK